MWVAYQITCTKLQQLTMKQITKNMGVSMKWGLVKTDQSHFGLLAVYSPK